MLPLTHAPESLPVADSLLGTFLLKSLVMKSKADTWPDSRQASELGEIEASEGIG